MVHKARRHRGAAGDRMFRIAHGAGPCQAYAPGNMATNLSAPKQITWLISLVLYVIALLAAFGVVSIDSQLALWLWIIGFGLLLVAVQVRGL